MRWKSEYKHPDDLYFIIEQQALYNVTEQKDQNEFCLYGYTHIDTFTMDLNNPQGECVSHQMDYHQDTLEMAKGYALEDFGVPLDSWVEIK